MISYDLRCTPNGHRFEGWFASSADFDRQRQDAMIACPLCGAQQVEKMLSAPNVGAKGNQRAEQAAPTPAPQPVETKGSAMNAATVPEPMRKMLTKLAEAQGKMLEKSEWVGNRFKEEVRAQHYGETEERQVHGEASDRDAAELAEEGIEVMPLLFPVAPPDKRH